MKALESVRLLFIPVIHIPDTSRNEHATLASCIAAFRTAIKNTENGLLRAVCYPFQLLLGMRCAERRPLVLGLQFQLRCGSFQFTDDFILPAKAALGLFSRPLGVCERQWPGQRCQESYEIHQKSSLDTLGEISRGLKRLC